jgi:hypothetical protein
MLTQFHMPLTQHRWQLIGHPTASVMQRNHGTGSVLSANVLAVHCNMTVEVMFVLCLSSRHESNMDWHCQRSQEGPQGAGYIKGD